MLICYCFIDIDRRTKLLTCRKGVFPSWNSKKHEILVTIDSSYPPSPGGMMEKRGDYCTHCAPSQLKNTEVNTLLKTLFLNSLLKASFTFVLGEILLQPSRFFIVNTILRNGPSQEWSWFCILVILRKTCRSIKNPWNIVSSVSK